MLNLPRPFSRRPGLFLATLLATLSLPAMAHEVWIEDTPEGQLWVRFAEYGEKFEKSPGALDALTMPSAWTPPAETKEEKPAEKPATETAASRADREIKDGKYDAFEVQKKADGFLLVGASPAKGAQIETGFTVMGKQGDPEKPARKPYFYARWQPPGSGATKPGLNFDIVPTDKAGEARVYFRGQPLAGVKLKLYPPGAAEQELVSDEAGLVHFTATKPGLYLLAGARHRESIPGFFGGKGYDVTSHNCALSWRQP